MSVGPVYSKCMPSMHDAGKDLAMVSVTAGLALSFKAESCLFPFYSPVAGILLSCLLEAMGGMVEVVSWQPG